MAAGPVVDRLFDENTDDYIPIFYHLGGEAGSGLASSRSNFYQLEYTPYMWFNGDDDAGFDSSQWESDLAAHQEQETDVTIRIFTTIQSPLLRVSATVCIEDGGESRAMRIFFAQVLDNFPESSTYYRNAARQGQSRDVSVEVGQCVDVEALMVLPAIDQEREDDFAVIVWAQEPHGTAPAEIFQVAIGGRKRPFPPDSLGEPITQVPHEDQAW